MGAIRFFVAGIPKSMRVGGVARFMRAGKMQTVPKREHSEWAVLVGHIGRQYAPESPFTGPVGFSATFFLPRPKTAAKKVVWALKRPDLDNLMSKLTDQWNGIFYADDSQIVELAARKVFAGDDRPGLEIVVVDLTEQGK